MVAIALLVHALAGAAPPSPSPAPVIIVDDPREIRSALGFAPEATFTPSQEDAAAPRRDLARYVDAERAREKIAYRKKQLGQISKRIDHYRWYCAGYKQKGETYLYCSFVLDSFSEPPPSLRKTFPSIADGGTSVCQCRFSLRTRQIVWLEWNGEA